MNREINSITRQEVKKLLLGKQVKGLVTNNLRIVISAVFAEAFEREIVPVNPAHRLGKFLKNERHKTPPKFLSKEQIGVVLHTARLHTPKYYDFILTAFRTGMRLGELIGLAWDSVDFYSKQIVVQRSFSHRHWDTPKSHKVRYVDMSDELHEALLDRYKQREPKLYCDSHTKKRLCLVFPDESGQPINDAVLRSGVFYKLLAQAGVPRIRIHDIRHTFAS